MSDERCHETREGLTELALGIADGAERARMLDHLAECADCRRELERQSQIADGLLTLAPEHEPPIGFELGILHAILPEAPRRRPLWRPAALVAVVAAAVAVTAGGMLLGFREDRRIADQYRAALAEANGTYFGSRPLTDAAGRRGGVLFVYRGAPSWILVVVDEASRDAVTGAELVDRGGGRISLPAFVLVDGAWGGAIPLDLQHVAAVQLAGDDGRSLLVATL
jgi:hypothetical protein